MKLSRWGNSLAVRLPRSHVQALGLREGDEVDIPIDAIRKVGGDQEERRAAALRRIEELSRPGPAGFKFDRDEIYDSMVDGAHKTGNDGD
jgi:antitoxin MazE